MKVTTIPQLKYVDDEDMVEIGMSKPEIRRLKKFFRKECPQGALGKIKRVSKITHHLNGIKWYTVEPFLQEHLKL